jgi:hypothetical protein
VSSCKACFTLACFVFTAAGATAAPPPGGTPAFETSGTATPRPVTALKLIGHTHARTAFCQAVYDHAGMATAAALENDQVISDTSVLLSHADLDENAMAKPKTIYDMQRSYEALMGRAHDAIDESKTLRKLAAEAPTPEQKAALTSYADAIGGALHRQEIVAKDYREFGVYLEAHDQVSWQQHDRDLMTASVTQPRPEEMAQDPRDRVVRPLAELSKLEAIHLTDIHEKVLDDEVHAATHVDDAFGPCAADSTP